MDSELEFIRSPTREFPIRSPVKVGIGDDGAVLQIQSSNRQIIVTDMLLDGIHFDLKTTSPESAGRKAVAVNLSDLAAMGCRPTAAFVSIAVPDRVPGGQTPFLHSLYQGIKAISDEFNLTVAGGDTNTWGGPFAINVCLTGEPFGAREVLRSGARPGDQIFVSGKLGGSLRNHRHLTFRPHLKEAEWLMGHSDVHAMMDISDGLAIDLHRMLESSNVGAVIDAAAIPIHEDVNPNTTSAEQLTAALSDGEDFVLLLTVSSHTACDLSKVTSEGPFFFHRIGEIISDQRCLIRHPDGVISALPVSGWQHRIQNDSI